MRWRTLLLARWRLRLFISSQPWLITQTLFINACWMLLIFAYKKTIQVVLLFLYSRRLSHVAAEWVAMRIPFYLGIMDAFINSHHPMSSTVLKTFITSAMAFTQSSGIQRMDQAISTLIEQHHPALHIVRFAFKYPMSGNLVLLQSLRFIKWALLCHLQFSYKDTQDINDVFHWSALIRAMSQQPLLQLHTEPIDESALDGSVAFTVASIASDITTVLADLCARSSPYRKEFYVAEISASCQVISCRILTMLICIENIHTRCCFRHYRDDGLCHIFSVSSAVSNIANTSQIWS